MPAGRRFPYYNDGMNTTSVSLLERLREAPDSNAWERLVRLYTPLLLYWGRRLGLQDQDAADLVQDVLIVLVQKLPEFQYQPGKSFRGWLRTVLMNKWRDRPHRTRSPLHSIATFNPRQRSKTRLEEREYRLFVMGQALRIMSADFEPATWQACWETVVVGRPAAEVAAEFGITVNAVYLAKCACSPGSGRTWQDCLTKVHFFSAAPVFFPTD